MRGIVTALSAALLLTGAPAVAQTSVEKRVERVEKELRAVQRKVFPGGAGQYFEPEISAAGSAAGTASGSTSAVTDLIARVDALESQLARLTGMVEQNDFQLRQLQDKVALLEGGTPETVESVSSSEAATSASAAAATSTASATADAGTAAPATPAPERVEGVAAVVKPETGDAGEDSYIYGYRLWDAGFYPEAQTQLKKTVEDHPNHRRASFAQNLLGRAYLDEGKPGMATRVFLESYQKMPRGERAPDSLYFLGEALVQLGEKDRACRAFEEMENAYPEAATGRLSDRVASGKVKAGC